MKELTSEEVKQYTLEALIFIDKFCKAHNITWWLCGGTLLGAVRHKGFIPWDDDIDIMLPRKEFEKLFSLFPSEGRYRFLTIDNTKSFPYTYGKIVDSYTLKNEHIRKRFQRIGIDIDVFPIDNLPSDREECEQFYKKIANLGRKLDGLWLNYGKGKSISSTILKNCFIFYQRTLERLGIISYEKIQRKFIALAQMYNNIDSDYCGITCINHYGIKERNLKSGYENSRMVEFEGFLFPAPECLETYLSQLYGNSYMQLPPKEKRITHHAFTAYLK